MSSRLETIPLDILQHIAFMCASSGSSLFEPPVDIFRLFQTSSTIYLSLNVTVTPDLYAHIFYTKFDMQASFRRYRKRMSNSALAAELVNRCRLLRRSYRLDFSPYHLVQDLWTALWMLLESDGLNEQQLSAVNFADFILCLARDKLADSNPDRWTDAGILEHILVWLLGLSLPRQLILDMSRQDRDDFYTLIFPYIFLSSSKTSEPLNSSSQSGSLSYAGLDDGQLTLPTPPASDSSHRIQVDMYTYLVRQNLSVLDSSTAAINLAFVILETTPVKIPYHLPETRAIANASQRSGPTNEDYISVASYQTPLFADSQPCLVPYHANSHIIRSGRSLQHDIEFGGVLRSLDPAGGSDAFIYRPGIMTGLWEGLYRTVDTPSGDPSSSMCLNPLLSMVIIKPMQCMLAEYICLDYGLRPGVVEGGTLDTNFCSTDFLDVKDDSELLFGDQKYKKYVPPTGTNPRPAVALDSLYDVILLGETLADHDQAWGGFKFSGRIHSNGRVFLKREPKDTSGDQGFWIFEGGLQRGTVILGRWRMTGNPNTVDHGIFSLGKTLEKWQA